MFKDHVKTEHPAVSKLMQVSVFFYFNQSKKKKLVNIETKYKVKVFNNRFQTSTKLNTRKKQLSLVLKVFSFFKKEILPFSLHKFGKNDKNGYIAQEDTIPWGLQSNTKS